MTANKRLLMLPGDGIGPEVVRQIYRVVDWMAKARGQSLVIEKAPFEISVRIAPDLP